MSADPTELEKMNEKTRKRKPAPHPPVNPGPNQKGADTGPGHVTQQTKKVRSREPKEYRPRTERRNSGDQGKDKPELVCSTGAPILSFNTIKSKAKLVP